MSELTLNSLEKDSMVKIIDDYKPSLEKLQEMVGGNIEVLTLNNGDLEISRDFTGQLSHGACLDLKKNYINIAKTKGILSNSH